ncbi:MAG: hypothetical protein UX49_C0021G0021 [Candidatus Wolfebacteria bacterium GW2011_GWC2_46_275]|uniref:Uncharacterized protein n=2 Tax=Candidatus Wolfeibacteriota TaxID=1752735 RepID=A0A0G4ASF9_9BACT|nr:MAG: hypothetical protein UX70_C0001G0798 [Candidatus Wolfebacteria bacterium GW2011_GWB1_47_1]KKU36197.1 MAG: hypothetical protein UX49_C0021G0021 [Candidatus Wolfebacteria bacterium GW2011_GWC2_46_275]KKU42086.1 MAG: hypothetical protein UX58_C0003G0010 [Candidatus Wolfebacteria bacterium GW2011_GWB2_46_69]KKU53717.1 MAG: hypothetical protein UX76_C0011G0062 [Candidatus Wolfebacteria bacterium GW2011_GWC1_47_103]KKU59325.1 MAG: hypothetical protein UX83_C0006G0095 [Candidatus Wolfebacteria
MNMREIKLDWLYRLGKVVLIIGFLIAIPIAIGMGSEDGFGGSQSEVFFYAALYLLLFYILLILGTKTTLYILKGERFLMAGFNKKHYALLGMPIGFLMAISLVYGVIIEPIKDNNARISTENAYIQALQKIDSLKEKVRECASPVIEQKYNEEMRSCNLLKNKIKHDYNFCVSLSYVNSPASCLYDHDYERVDCSEAVLREKASAKVTEFDLSASCQGVWKEFNEVDEIIRNHK